jgi:hypothetical protein
VNRGPTGFFKEFIQRNSFDSYLLPARLIVQAATTFVDVVHVKSNRTRDVGYSLVDQPYHLLSL